MHPRYPCWWIDQAVTAQVQIKAEALVARCSEYLGHCSNDATSPYSIDVELIKALQLVRSLGCSPLLCFTPEAVHKRASSTLEMLAGTVVPDERDWPARLANTRSKIAARFLRKLHESPGQLQALISAPPLSAGEQRF